ncbi:MAG: polyribonucleotide nucleotidyltransferase [Cytophagales bacterium]|nr:MAG: polyribonucleotide nucleotidyltransferase [Cytophagales bacterium]
MLPQIYQQTITLPDGREIIIETGKLARQADGSVMVKCGNTMLLATVVSDLNHKEGIDFLPLSVDYQEKFASTGRIPGSFQKREGKLSDYEILISRLVDRVIRPLFPEDYHSETQINIHLISADYSISPDSLAALAASAALSVSDIPFNGPISEVRVIQKNNQFIVNPSVADLENATLDIVVGASYDHILMVEGEMREVSEATMIEAIKVAHEAIKPHCIAQKELTEKVGKTEKRQYSHETHDEALKNRMYEELYTPLYQACASYIENKKERSATIKAIKEAFVEKLKAEATTNATEMPNEGLISRYFGEIHWKASRDMVIKERKRLDGRQLEQIRQIWCEVNYLPNAHGSALFTRGETQSLTTITLGTKLDEQLIDSALHLSYSKFMLHYNFPSFSTGEVKPNRAPGRREIGHGNLAFRALKNMLPPDDQNPYTIRIVSDILESNGSSSMATVCAGTLALMDAGIPIKAPVAGIAMGLISDEKTQEYAVLSDILGDEDHLGDMDFKVTGTAEGITACQMDIKTSGLTFQVLEEALEQARRGRLHILSKMIETIPTPNPDLKPHAPRSQIIKIDTSQIGAVIGPGGKVVQEIQKTTGATIVIEEKDNAGFVNIFANNQEVMDAAVDRVKKIVAVPEPGEIYDGIVKSIMPFGAFIEFLPGKEGLLHISEIKWERLENMEGVLEIGEEVKVKLLEVDKKTGKYRLSRKVLIPKPNNN